MPIEALDVTVADGWVTLHGEVEWEYQRRAAERAVGRLTGVRGVSNGITVRPAVRADGRDLAERIVDALARNGATEAERISVRVHGDTVVLDGPGALGARTRGDRAGRLVRARHPRGAQPRLGRPLSGPGRVSRPNHPARVIPPHPLGSRRGTHD